jgi:hypothetical protein
MAEVSRNATFGKAPEIRQTSGVAKNATFGGSTFDPSPGQKIVGGFLRGLREDPITGKVFDTLLETFPEGTEEAVGALIHRTKRSKLADAAAVVGEYGPAFALGMGAYSAGRRLAVGGLARLASPSLDSTLGKVAARNLLTSTQQAQKFGRKGVAALFSTPLIERSTQIAGGAVGFGLYGGASELANGAPMGDAAKAALLHGALSGAFEATLFGVTSLPVIGLKSVKDPTKIEALFEKEIMPFLSEETKRIKGKMGKITNQINRIVGTSGQQQNLAVGQQLQLLQIPKRPRTPQEIDLLKKKQKALGSLKSQLKAIKQIRQSPIAGYLRGEPYDPKGFFETLAKFRLQTLQTPESFRGQLGRTMNRFIEMVDEAETHVKIASSFNELTLKTMQQNLGSALGFSRKQTKDGRNFGRIFNAWEKFGEVGVRNFMKNEGRGQFADDAVSMFKDYNNGLGEMYNNLVKLGAEPKLKMKDLLALGVARFIPHVLDNIPERAAVDKLAKAMGRDRAQALFNAANRQGLRKFGSIDFQRTLQGSLAEKLGRDLPFNANPFDASLQYLNAVHRRLEYGKRFGMSGEIKSVIQDAAVKEGANPGIVKSLVDLALDHRYYDEALQQFSKSVTGLQTSSKLGLAMIPNMSQSINTIVLGGMMNFTRGLLLALRGESRNEILRSVALMESLVEGMGRTFGRTTAEGVKNVGTGFTASANLMDEFAHQVLRWSGFKQVERWNRILAGSTGFHIIHDTLAKNAAGKLKGATLDIARRRMTTLGIDLDKATRLLLNEGKDSEAFKELIRLGMFKASTVTQFNPNILRKPILWQHPAGRILAQFKTFALGQGRFLRDQVLLEAKHGNMKPMAYFLSIYPIAGEVVAETRALARLSPRKVTSYTGDDDVDRVIQDFTMVGGFGLLSDMFTSARFGKPLEGLLGPTASDIAQLSVSLAQGRPENVLRQILKTPTAQGITTVAKGVGAAGYFGVEGMSRYLDSLESDADDSRRGFVDLGKHQAEEKRRRLERGE